MTHKHEGDTSIVERKTLGLCASEDCCMLATHGVAGTHCTAHCQIHKNVGEVEIEIGAPLSSERPHGSSTFYQHRIAVEKLRSVYLRN